ncbi:MAG TPA: MFS transporter [Steroidobacteraceae bacterium]|nr:MFS transporter [Steroidobacteraceae bacterium]
MQASIRVTDAYRYYVAWLLCGIYTISIMDRQLVAILVEPIRTEFALQDWHMGLLSGLSFALFYTTLGVPLARLADRNNRVNIMAVSLLVWSAFTGLTGLAKTFVHLLIARIGVAVGEAGCNPAAYSLIGDYFEPRRRATALSIFQMGGYIGSFLGLLLGGWIGHTYGWRAAFLIVGLPGIAVALLLKLTLRELPRGYSDPVRAVVEPPPVGRVLRDLWAKPSFRHLSLAAALHNFAVYGVGNWYAAFLMRSHGMSLAATSTTLAIVTVIGGAAGTYLGGMLSDRYATRRQDSRYYLWVPALSLLIGFPLSQGVLLFDDTNIVIALLSPVVMCSAAYLAPSITATYTLIGIRERALASALLLFVINLIGLGLGPLFAGIASDQLRQMFVERGLSEAEALGEGLRWALRIIVAVNLWSAMHYFIAARTLRAEAATG